MRATARTIRFQRDQVAQEALDRTEWIGLAVNGSHIDGHTWVLLGHVGLQRWVLYVLGLVAAGNGRRCNNRPNQSVAVRLNSGLTAAPSQG